MPSLPAQAKLANHELRGLLGVNTLRPRRVGEILKKSARQLLRKIYGGRADAHLDLYGLSNQHRRKHGRGCDMFPSDPLQAPLWAVLASLTHARRILEVGCGHGYTAAVMASAAGPDCRVDTIEEDLIMRISLSSLSSNEASPRASAFSEAADKTSFLG